MTAPRTNLAAAPAPGGMTPRVPAAPPADLADPASLTHLHLLAVINTELARRASRLSAPVRVLDAGCGDGLFLAYLVGALKACRPDLSFEFHGFDVADHGVQPPGYFADTIDRLVRASPDQAWADRLVLISERDPWPYADGFFDVIVSNQVLEHVSDHGLFFSEMARTLRVGGFSAHMFPLGHSILEPHLKTPFAHWFRSADLVAGCLRFWSRLGVGKFDSKETDRARRAADLDRYVSRHTDYLIRYTNYLSQGEMLRFAKRAKLHASFRYTARYYQEKIHSLAGGRRSVIYRRPKGAIPAGLMLLCRYVASVTLVAERDESYSGARDVVE